MNEIETVTLGTDAVDIRRAGDILASGGLVAFPTETVYGLGADAGNDRAVARIFEAKGRPSFNPLIVHVTGMSEAKELCAFNDNARALAQAFWPGALTLVLPLRQDAAVSKLVTAGQNTLAIRVPDHPLARDVLTCASVPIAAPSANPSGRISPTRAAHVLAGLAGRIDAVIDGGACAVGVESTIVDCSGAPRLLRAGGVPAEAVEACLPVPLETDPISNDQTPKAPGLLASHYAPKGLVRLNAIEAAEDEIMLGFGETKGDLTLSDRGDLVEAAARLFQCLHRLDQMGAERIAVAPIPLVGLGLAINDRLRRAAAPRP